MSEVETLLARGWFLLVERGGALEGSVYVEDRGDHGYIGLVSVDPALQRSGLGRALMAAAEQSLRDLGRPRVELVVVSLRDRAPALVRQAGLSRGGDAAVSAARAQHAAVPLRRHVEAAAGPAETAAAPRARDSGEASG